MIMRLKITANKNHMIYLFLYIQGVPYHNFKPWTGDRPVYDGPEPKHFFLIKVS